MRDAMPTRPLPCPPPKAQAAPRCTFPRANPFWWWVLISAAAGGPDPRSCMRVGSRWSNKTQLKTDLHVFRGSLSLLLVERVLA